MHLDSNSFSKRDQNRPLLEQEKLVAHNLCFRKSGRSSSFKDILGIVSGFTLTNISGENWEMKKKQASW